MKSTTLTVVDELEIVFSDENHDFITIWPTYYIYDLLSHLIKESLQIFDTNIEN
jgi:hypothetical protein